MQGDEFYRGDVEFPWNENSKSGTRRFKSQRIGHNAREVGCVSDTEIDQPFFERVNLKTAWYQSFNTGKRNFLLRPYIFVPCVLAFMFSLVVYTERPETMSTLGSFKMALFITASMLVLIGTLILPDGPFIRPHPAFWKAVLSVGIVYELIITFFLSLDKRTVRKLLSYLDPELGQRPIDVYYADKCDFTWQVIGPKLDVFVLAHTIGWAGKAIILRDYNLCWFLSIAFEVMEILLEYKFPNFEECWWDRWFLDVLITNWLGIYIGMGICKYYAMKKYTWTRITDIPTFKGKLKRSVQQLTPRSWLIFEWPAAKSFSNYLIVLSLAYLSLQLELNTFYLKHLLWIETRHSINTLRLILLFFMCLPAVCEYYKYLIDRRCKTVGIHSAVTILIIITEALICYKFSTGEFHNPAPLKTIIGWTVIIGSVVMYGLVKFGFPCILKYLK